MKPEVNSRQFKFETTRSFLHTRIHNDFGGENHLTSLKM